MRLTQGKRVAVVVQAGGGTDLDFGYDGIATVMLSGEQTGGTLAALSCTQTAETGPPAHVHYGEDELFIVVEGQYSFLVGDAWTDVGPGALVYLPRGTVHCYRVNGPAAGRHWILTTPAGFERFFARLAAETTRPGGPDMQRVVETSREHGIEYVDKNASSTSWPWWAPPES